VWMGQEIGDGLNGPGECYATATRCGPNAITVTLTDGAGRMLRVRFSPFHSHDTYSLFLLRLRAMPTSGR